jgi:pimeloyl-ACP methyl ester carboxylesterase
MALSLLGASSTGCADATSAVPDASTPADASPGPDAGTPPAATCTADPGAGDHVATCEGFTYDLHVPAACAGGGCGIVLDVHGASMNGRLEDNNSNMRVLGERDGYVVVQPNAKGTPPATVWNGPTDDDPVWAFFKIARQAYRTDPKRVHVTGFSQGARMTFALLCAHADEIASAAPAADPGCTAAELKAAKREVPLLYMHGRQDGVESFTKLAVPQRDDIVSAWAMPPPMIVASDSMYTWSRYTNANGTVFEFLEHDYTAASSLLKGHCFPGSTDTGTDPGEFISFACVAPTAFVWSEAVMKFFKAHPLP